MKNNLLILLLFIVATTLFSFKTDPPKKRALPNEVLGSWMLDIKSEDGRIGLGFFFEIYPWDENENLLIARIRDKQAAREYSPIKYWIEEIQGKDYLVSETLNFFNYPIINFSKLTACNDSIIELRPFSDSIRVAYDYQDKFLEFVRTTDLDLDDFLRKDEHPIMQMKRTYAYSWNDIANNWLSEMDKAIEFEDKIPDYIFENEEVEKLMEKYKWKEINIANESRAIGNFKLSNTQNFYPFSHSKRSVLVLKKEGRPERFYFGKRGVKDIRRKIIFTKKTEKDHSLQFEESRRRYEKHK